MTSKLERQQLGALIEEWDGPIYRLARRWLGNDADAADATQEIFLVLVRDLHQLRDPSKRGAWIMTVARRVLGRFKARRNQRRSSEEPAESLDPSVDEASLAQRDRDLLIRDSVEALPEELREVIELHFFMGLTQREAAAMLNLPRTTVQRRLERSFKQLRPQLAGAAALAPDLGEWLQGPPIKPPSSLRAQLLEKLGEAPALPGVLAKGGIIMKLKTGASIVLITGLSVLGGFTAGELTAEKPEAVAPEASPVAAQAGPAVTAPRPRPAQASAEARARELREESAALKARVIAARASLDALEKSAAVAAAKAPSAAAASTKPEAEEEDEAYLLSGQLIAMLVELEGAGSAAEADAIRQRYFREQPDFIQAVFKDPQRVAIAMVRRLSAGDPPLEAKHHLACIGSALSVPLDDAARRVVFDHMAAVVTSPAEPMSLRAELIPLYANHDPAQAPDHFRALARVGARLDDPSLLFQAGRILELLGRSAQDEARALFRDGEAPELMRAAALRALEDARLSELSELVYRAVDSEEEAMRSSALERLSGLPSSARARRILEGRLDTDAAFFEAALAEASLVKHGDRGTLGKLESIAADAARPAEVRARAAELVSLLERGLAAREEGR